MKLIGPSLILLMSATSPALGHDADKYFRAFCAPVARESCEKERATFRDLYVKAFKKDYQAQRNVAYLLSKGNDAVFPDPIAACAWRMVITDSGSPKVDASDHANSRVFCDRIDAARRAEARSIATVIAKRIEAGGTIDTSIPKEDPTLDGTAEPL